MDAIRLAAMLEIRAPRHHMAPGIPQKCSLMSNSMLALCCAWQMLYLDKDPHIDGPSVMACSLYVCVFLSGCCISVPTTVGMRGS